MPTLRIPTKQMNMRRTDFVWPAGAFTGTIESVETRNLPETKDGRPFGGYTSTEGKQLNIRLGSNEPADGAKVDLGARKKFLEITTVDGDLTIFDNQTALEAAKAWELLRSQRIAANLAAALGGAEANGDTTEVTGEWFSALEDGTFNGERVQYTTYHRTYKKQDGSQGVAVEIESIGPA